MGPNGINAQPVCDVHREWDQHDPSPWRYHSRPQKWCTPTKSDVEWWKGGYSGDVRKLGDSCNPNSKFTVYVYLDEERTCFKRSFLNHWVPSGISDPMYYPSTPRPISQLVQVGSQQASHPWHPGPHTHLATYVTYATTWLYNNISEFQLQGYCQIKSNHFHFKPVCQANLEMSISRGGFPPQQHSRLHLYKDMCTTSFYNL